MINWFKIIQMWINNVILIIILIVKFFKCFYCYCLIQSKGCRIYKVLFQFQYLYSTVIREFIRFSTRLKFILWIDNLPKWSKHEKTLYENTKWFEYVLDRWTSQPIWSIFILLLFVFIFFAMQFNGDRLARVQILRCDDAGALLQPVLFFFVNCLLFFSILSNFNCFILIF